jgi:3-oxoacyl-[acyl-carrier protein] reductase
MDTGLKGKVAVVTGGSRGIGRAIALHLATEGVAIAVNYNERADAAAEVVAEIQKIGGSAIAVRADVGLEQAVTAMVERTVEEFGGLDILVNNAGIPGGRHEVAAVTPEIWRKVMAVNLDGVYLCSRASIPHLQAGRGGRIVNIAARVGLAGIAGFAPYATAKGGIIAFTKSLAKELAKDGITVNAIVPGATRTDFISFFTKEQLEATTKTIPMGRIAEPEDIAKLVVFLASKQAAYITGEAIGVLGGQ